MDSVSSQQQLIDISAGLTPYQKFSYALNAPESQRQYPGRFQQFLDFLQINETTIEENVNTLYNLIEKNGTRWLEVELLKFFRLRNQRAERKEISTETIRNYLKPIKLFCQIDFFANFK
jgi:hypothetical protein